MRIILVISDQKGRNIKIVTDSLEILSFSDGVNRVRQHAIDGFHVARRGGYEFIRKNRGSRESISLDALTIPIRVLVVGSSFEPLSFFSTYTHAKTYWAVYQDLVRARIARGETPIQIDGTVVTTREYVQERIAPSREHFFDAGARFAVDPYLIGAISVDEVARLAPLEDLRDPPLLLATGKNVSIGIMQVNMDTARDVIEKGFYSPNPTDEFLSAKNIHRAPRVHFYQYIADPRHNVFFGAARVRQIYDWWRDGGYPDIGPDIIGTLYSQGLGTPKPDPKPIERGTQIATEFYALAREILGAP